MFDHFGSVVKLMPADFGVRQGRSTKVALMAKAWTMQGGHGPLARPAGLPARLSGERRT